MPKPFLVLLLLLALPLSLVHAQEAAAPAATGTDTPKKPQKRLDWPHTFGGQPDFEFERGDALADRVKAAAAAGAPAASPPIMADLLEDAPLDPLHLAAAPLRTVSGTTVSGTAVTAGGSVDGAVPSLLAASGALPRGELPKLAAPDITDTTAFTAGLTQALNDFMFDWQPDLARYSTNVLTDNLKLQTVVTSPGRYAIINGQRFSEGDRFQLPLTLGPNDVELIDLLQQRLPPEGTLTAETMQKYRDAVDDAIQQLATDREKNPGRYQTTVQVPVTVVSIESRHVVITLNGQRQDLTIKQAL